MLQCILWNNPEDYAIHLTKYRALQRMRLTEKHKDGKPLKSLKRPN